MEQGIPPREASDRLNIFQAKFDELWRKYQTYSGGEELFGLTVTEYPDMFRIKKELNLLQKLYQLYNAVLEDVNGYYDIPWAEIQIEKINQELIDFQNRWECSRQHDLISYVNIYIYIHIYSNRIKILQN